MRTKIGMHSADGKPAAFLMFVLLAAHLLLEWLEGPRNHGLIGANGRRGCTDGVSKTVPVSP